VFVSLLFNHSPQAAVADGVFYSTGFRTLDPPSIPLNRFGRSIAAAHGKVLVGGSDQYSYVYDIATGTEVHRLRGTDTQINDIFGQAVAVSDDYAVVTANQALAAYVFDVNSGQQLRKFSDVNPPPPGIGSSFGLSLALSDELTVIGEPNDDTKATHAGAAYLFNISTGQLVRTFFPPGPAATVDSDAFGGAVDIENNILVVGAPGAASATSNSGAAYVFDLTTGNHIRTLLPTDTTVNFGGTVEIAGNLAIIGDTNVNGSGAAYLFNLQTGQQLTKFVSPNPSNAGGFGHSIAFDGSRVAHWKLDGTDR
jgi:WD40 repeat protein